MTRTGLQLPDEGSLRAMAELRGARWLLFGGAILSDAMLDVSVFFVTDGPAITLSGMIDYLDFEGDEDNYSCFGVERGAAELDEAKKAGGIYYHFQGQEVRDVLVVRQTVQAHKGAEHLWTYESDLAVVVQLETGVVAVAKVSQHTELLTVVTAPGVAELRIEEPISSWDDDLEIRHGYTRHVVPVAALLGG